VAVAVAVAVCVSISACAVWAPGRGSTQARVNDARAYMYVSLSLSLSFSLSLSLSLSLSPPLSLSGAAAAVLPNWGRTCVARVARAHAAGAPTIAARAWVQAHLPTPRRAAHAPPARRTPPRPAPAPPPPRLLRSKGLPLAWDAGADRVQASSTATSLEPLALESSPASARTDASRNGGSERAPRGFPRPRGAARATQWVASTARDATQATRQSEASGEHAPVPSARASPPAPAAGEAPCDAGSR